MDGRIDPRTCGLLFVVGVILALVDPVAAQPAPRVDARVSADSVKVGERFTLTLVAEHASDVEVLFPAGDTDPAVFGDLHALGRGEVQRRSVAESRRVDSVAYDVAAFAVDSARVPVLPVRLVAGGDTTVVGSSPRFVPVISVVGPEAEGLRTPAALASFPRPAWVWMLLVAGGAVLLGGLAYVWWRRRGAEDQAGSVEPEDPRTPYEAASAQLQQLERRNPNDRQSCKAFYVDLSEALRVYLARRLGVRSLESTTPELIAALRRQPTVSDAAVQRLRAVLERADLVKFADVRPDPAESRAVLKKARGVLDAIEAAQRRSEDRVPAE